jgi:hypothetical protein
MAKKVIIISVILVILLGLTGFVVFKSLTKAPAQTVTQDQPVEETIPQIDKSVVMDVKKSSTKDHTIVVSVTGMAGKYSSIGYEVSYQTNGVLQGINSGATPIDVSGKSDFEREVYLGTCSRNVCTPHTNVTKVTTVLKFTDVSGKVYQSSKDLDLQ